MPEIPDDFLSDVPPDPVLGRFQAKDIVTVHLTACDLALALHHADEACVGGKSAIFGDKAERADNLKVNNQVGQIVTLAGHLWLYGTDALYVQDRERQNQHKTTGDGGSDVGADSNIDFKGSLMKRSPDPLTYNLLVRPDEMHQDWVYVLGLVQYEGAQPLPNVFLVGWASTDMLKFRYTDATRFGGQGKVHAMHATDLRPLPPFRWPTRRPLRYI